MKNTEKNFKKIQNHLKEFGFIFQGSEIYGGLSNTWDYGPLGVLLSKNLKDFWWKEFIQREPNNFGIDSKILMNTKVWEASGHTNNFSDLLVENKTNGKRYRATFVVNDLYPEKNADLMSAKELEVFLSTNVFNYDGSKCEWGQVHKFNLMFETHQGVIQDNKTKVYLRPETAQGIFINFLNVQRSTRTKLPFGIGQIGKSFRNEITPGNYIFRTREFEQMELEYFVNPKEDIKSFEYYVAKSWDFLLKVGLKNSSMKLRKHQAKELAHYSKATTDVEFQFPFGWGELMGIANRTDFDLKNHSQFSEKSLEYLDPFLQKKIIPYAIEPSIGVDRLILAVLVDSFEEEKLTNDTQRIILKIQPMLAPYQIAVLPLVKKHHSLAAKKLFKDLLKQDVAATYDDVGSIGKRYRRQDAIGTPFVITVIDDTTEKQTVTIRFRDSMKQETIKVQDIKKYLEKIQNF